MDANKRSEVNNQTNNGANEKWTPGSKGNTRDAGPLDHTYPQGASQQQGQQPGTGMAAPQSGSGPGAADGQYGRSDGAGQDLHGGSMQTQQTGGTGAQQGITDSHQRAMEQRSGAYGKLEQPVGERPNDQGSSLRGNQGHSGSMQSSTRGGGQAGPQAAVPRQQGGSMGQQSTSPQGTQGGGQLGQQADEAQGQRGGSMSQQSSSSQGTQGGGKPGMASVRPSGSMNAQESTDRNGSQTGNYQRETGGHQSNDSAGGLPRSPGGSGPYPQPRSTHLTGADNLADLQRDDIGIHDSNNSSGGLPRSPGGANKLAADEKMDDDTGFSNPRR
jgi:hypothetical protein